MIDMTKWRHKDEWRRSGKDFAVMVSRHSESDSCEPTGCFDSEGPNRWCVYAFIYPKHPHFVNFNGLNMWQDATSLGFHGGCSFLKYHHDNNGNIVSIQCGCDYNHLGDWEYTRHATPDEAYEVLRDAENIFKRLQSMIETSGVAA